MSLNRLEQTLHDYIVSHPEERHFWQNKVRALNAGAAEPSQAVGRLDAELWRYYEERSAVVASIKEAVRAYGLKRTSMKNLAEYLSRLWVEPKPRKPPAGGSGTEFTPHGFA